MVTYLTAPELAEELRVSERTLERLRVKGTGPEFTKAGRKVLYSRTSVNAWLERNTYASTSQAEAAT